MSVNTGNQPGDLRARPARSLDGFRETKPSFMTTEFWAMIVGLAAVVVIYNAASDASFKIVARNGGWYRYWRCVHSQPWSCQGGQPRRQVGCSRP